MTAAMFEFDDVDLNDPLRQELVSIEQKWRDLLTRLTKEAVDSGELSSDVDPEQLAWELCGIYLVHHISQRFNRDPRATQRALRAFDSLTRRSSKVAKPKKRLGR